MSKKVVITILLSLCLVSRVGLTSPNYSKLRLKANLEKYKKNNKKKMSWFSIKNIVFPTKIISDMKFSRIKWQGINLSAVELTNVEFKNCKFLNVSFKKATLKNVTFRNCTLYNVEFTQAQIETLIFINTKILASQRGNMNVSGSFDKLKANKIHFIKSKIIGADFEGSKGKFIFEKSNVRHVNGYSLKPGSELIIINSVVARIDFDYANLAKLSITDSSIDDSKINSAFIKVVILKNSTLKSVAISDIRKSDSLTADGIKGLSIGGSIKNISVTNCDGDYPGLYLGELKFETAVIDNCQLSSFVAFDSIDGKMTVRNLEVNTLNINRVKLDELVFENVKVGRKLYYEEARVKKYSARNVFLHKSIKLKKEGSNFTIISVK